MTILTLGWRRCLVATVSLMAASLLPAAAASSLDQAEVRAIVDATIKPLMTRYSVPGMAVAVTVGGQAYIFNYGLADKRAGKPVSDATLFELGSISKTLTATLGAYAQTTGKLSLSEHPGKYMSELKGRPIDQSTLLNLATYTAGGLPLQFPEDDAGQSMTAYFQQWQPKAAPGTQRVYSNPSIGLYGHIVGLALKSDFADAMEQQLFPQLGLRHSYIRIPADKVADYAWGDDDDGRPRRMNPGMLADQAYGVRSTASDMLRFVEANIDPSRLREPFRQAVRDTHIGYFNIGQMTQGLGWERYDYPITLDSLLAGNSSDMIMQANRAQPVTPPQAPARLALFNKTGSTGGFGNYIAFVPGKKIGIVLLANKNYEIPARVAAAHAILLQLAR